MSLHFQMARKKAPARSIASGRPITRAEFDRMATLVDECCHNLDVQFKRFADMQAELDRIKSAWTKARIQP